MVTAIPPRASARGRVEPLVERRRDVASVSSGRVWFYNLCDYLRVLEDTNLPGIRFVGLTAARRHRMNRHGACWACWLWDLFVLLHTTVRSPP